MAARHGILPRYSICSMSYRSTRLLGIPHGSDSAAQGHGSPLAVDRDHSSAGSPDIKYLSHPVSVCRTSSFFLVTFFVLADCFLLELFLMPSAFSKLRHESVSSSFAAFWSGIRICSARSKFFGGNGASNRSLGSTFIASAPKRLIFHDSFYKSPVIVSRLWECTCIYWRPICSAWRHKAHWTDVVVTFHAAVQTEAWSLDLC